MICQFTLVMACDLLYTLVKFSHELEDIMAIYDNMRTIVIYEQGHINDQGLVQLITRCNFFWDWLGDCVQCLKCFLTKLNFCPIFHVNWQIIIRYDFLRRF